MTPRSEGKRVQPHEAAGLTPLAYLLRNVYRARRGAAYLADARPPICPHDDDPDSPREVLRRAAQDTRRFTGGD